ncbi:uncharacterized protein LOC144539799 [Centroberyx gerrardi]
MVHYTASKPLGLVLIVTARMVFSGPSRTEVTGFLGDRIFLQFKVENMPNTSIISVGLYKNTVKIHECPSHRNCSGSHVCAFHKTTVSAFYCIGNLTLGDSGNYLATFFNRRGIPTASNEISLIVRVPSTNSTVPPTAANSTDTTAEEILSPTDFSSLFFSVLGLSAAVLMVALLSWLIWSFKRTKEQQQQDPNPTVQGTAEASSRVPAAPLVYSVLDFPKRGQAGVEIQPRDTEYAAISYPTHSQVRCSAECKPVGLHL